MQASHRLHQTKIHQVQLLPQDVYKRQLYPLERKEKGTAIQWVLTNKGFYKREMSLIIADFQILFYQTKYAELEVEIDTLEKERANKDAAEMARQMADTSMKYLKNQLFHTYGNNHDKPIFTLPDLRNNWREVQKEYPIILSTTFSSLSSLQRDRCV